MVHNLPTNSNFYHIPCYWSETSQHEWNLRAKSTILEFTRMVLAISDTICEFQSEAANVLIEVSVFWSFNLILLHCIGKAWSSASLTIFFKIYLVESVNWDFSSFLNVEQKFFVHKNTCNSVKFWSWGYSLSSPESSNCWLPPPVKILLVNPIVLLWRRY